MFSKIPHIYHNLSLIYHNLSLTQEITHLPHKCRSSNIILVLISLHTDMKLNHSNPRMPIKFTHTNRISISLKTCRLFQIADSQKAANSGKQSEGRLCFEESESSQC